MNIYFSPAYTSSVYALSSDQEIIFDAVIMGEPELLALLELYAGIQAPDKNSSERDIDYFKCVNDYIEKNEDSLIAKSFKSDNLGTSKMCLKWRDALVLAGWKKSDKAFESPRLQMLNEIEKNFNTPGFPDRWRFMIDILKENIVLPASSVINVGCKKEFLPPYITELFDILSEKGSDIIYEDLKLSDKRNNRDNIQDLFCNDIIKGITIDCDATISF